MTPRPTADPAIGDRIRTRRQVRGWSIRHAASRAGLSHATWSRIERGLQAADNRFTLADMAAALECAPADLAGAPVPATDRAAMAAQASVYALRQSLIDADPAFPGAAPSDPGVASFEPAAFLESASAGPASADGGSPGVAGLARTLALADSLRRACDYAGAARLLPDLVRDLHAATAGPDRTPALRMLCDATFIASSVLRNLGHPGEAWLGAERCHTAALATGDPILPAYAAYARACAAAACGSYERGLTLATRAADDLRPHLNRPGGPEMLGSLQLICAYTSRGARRDDDSRSWCEAAADLATRTGETTTMGMYFGPANVGIWRIGIEADGGDPGHAVQIAGATPIAAIPAGFRQVFYYADTARALTRLRGRDREAIRFLLTAERIAPQHLHTSAVAQETTRALLDRSRRQAGGTELRGLCERMQVA